MPDPDVLAAIVAEAGSASRPAAVLFQDYQVRCRMAGLSRPPLDLEAFSRRLAAARAGITHGLEDEWAGALSVARELPSEMLGPFLLIARAAKEGEACPPDERIAEVYGTSSLGRARRLVGYMEQRELIVCRTDLGGKRSIAIPALGWTTAPA